MSTYATLTRSTGQRLTDVFAGPDGWCAHVTGSDTREARVLASAITTKSGQEVGAGNLITVGADRLPNSTLYLLPEHQ